MIAILQMDEYGGYVWAAYLLSVVVLGGLGLRIWIRGRHTKRLLTRLSKNAPEDQSPRGHGDPGRT